MDYVKRCKEKLVRIKKCPDDMVVTLGRALKMIDPGAANFWARWRGTTLLVDESIQDEWDKLEPIDLPMTEIINAENQYGEKINYY